MNTSFLLVESLTRMSKQPQEVPETDVTAVVTFGAIVQVGIHVKNKQTERPADRYTTLECLLGLQTELN